MQYSFHLKTLYRHIELCANSYGKLGLTNYIRNKNRDRIRVFGMPIVLFRKRKLKSV